jgi:hypothetical protein
VRTQSIFTVCFALLSNLEIAQNAGIAQPLSAQKENSPPAYEASSAEENIPELNLPMGAIVLKKGTEVKIAFAQSLSSKHATIGEKVELRVTEDVRVAEKVAIPKGARAIGIVTTGKKNEKRGNSKDLAVRIDYIVVKEKRIPLTGMQQQKPKTKVSSATAATIGLGLSGLMIYMNQREAWIREGTPAIGYIAEDVVILP